MKDRIIAAMLAASCVGLTIALTRPPHPVVTEPPTIESWRAGSIRYGIRIVEPNRSDLYERRLAEVNIDGLTFSQAIAAISLQSGVSIIVRQGDHAYAQVKFDDPAPITLRLRNVTLGQALAALIGATGDTSREIHLFAGADAITIAPESSVMLQGPFTGIYNVRDLVREQQKQGRSYRESIDAIEEPLSSPDLDGIRAEGVGKIDEVAGVLVIYATTGRHRLIAEALRRMHESVRSVPVPARP